MRNQLSNFVELQSKEHHQFESISCFLKKVVMIKAVIVDDEPYSCDTLSTLLERHCPEVAVIGICQSGKAALEKIPYLQPQLLFLDIEMPHLNGFQLLEKLNEHNFKLIFTTSYDQYAIKAIRFSAIDYLLKPIDPSELKQAVQKAIQYTFSHCPNNWKF